MRPVDGGSGLFNGNNTPSQLFRLFTNRTGESLNKISRTLEGRVYLVYAQMCVYTRLNAESTFTYIILLLFFDENDIWLIYFQYTAALWSVCLVRLFK